MKDNSFLQKIFQAYYPSYERRHTLPLKHHKAARALMRCRTELQGYSTYSCEKGHPDKNIYHACRHRSCPACASRKQTTWLNQQCDRILPCRHYHIIFTLPHEYLALWQYNTHWFTQAIFKTSQQTLFELLADPKYLGAKPGIIMSLHSWGRQLNLHPHVHSLVTAGGVTESGNWKSVQQEFLLPIRVVKCIYRGKFQALIKTALQAGELTLPPDKTAQQVNQLINSLYRKQWSVRIQPPYEHGDGVLNYLSRYITGGPLKAGQVVQADAEKICLNYKNHRTNRTQVMTLTKDKFIRRLLLHVPEPGLHTVRHYGLYAAACKARDKLRLQWPKRQKKIAFSSVTPIKCSCCDVVMKLVFSHYPAWQKGNSYIKESNPKYGEGLVQPNVQAASLHFVPP